MPGFEEHSNELQLEFEIGKEAPMHLWDDIHIPDFSRLDKMPDEFYDLVDICRMISEQLENLDLNQELEDGIKRINSVNMFDDEVEYTVMSTNEMGEQVPSIQTTFPRNLLKKSFCTLLLQALFKNNDKLNKGTQELLNNFAKKFAENKRYFASEVKLFGTKLPIPEDVVVIYGSSRWDYIRRTYKTETDLGSEKILYIPVNQDWKTEKTVVNIAGIFGDKIKFKRALEDPSLILEDIVRSGKNEKDTDFVFAAIERYIAYQCFTIGCLAEFIKYYVNSIDPGNIPGLVGGYAAGVALDTIDQIFTDPNAVRYLLPYLENKELPQFEEPTAHSRNTRHLNFEEHVKSVQLDKKRSVRSVEELKEEVRKILFAPLEEIYK